MAREAGVPLETLPVGIGLCVDEEIGGTGSIAMARTTPAAPSSWGWREPSCGWASPRPGSSRCGVTCEGVAVHGALRELGENAIDDRARADRTHPSSIPDPQHEHPLLGRNIPMIWEIRGGQRLNVVPDRCSFHLDWRVTPGGPSAASLLAWLEEATADRRRRGRARRGHRTVRDRSRCRGRDGARATRSRPPPGSEACRPTGMVAWTDAHNFVDLGGSQAVVFGPGASAQRAPRGRMGRHRRHRPVRPGARGTRSKPPMAGSRRLSGDRALRRRDHRGRSQRPRGRVLPCARRTADRGARAAIHRGWGVRHGGVRARVPGVTGRLRAVDAA